MSLIRAFRTASSLCCLALMVIAPSAHGLAPVDLTGAAVVVRGGDLPKAEEAAATVLVEEIAKRTGITLPVVTSWPSGKTAIAITSEPKVAAWKKEIPACAHSGDADGYRLYVESGDTPVVWVIGGDPRGTLYGVGALLRKLEWGDKRAELPAGLDIDTAPVSPIRGHQLGYRDTANSWDSWTPEQFDQYIRELAFFGINSIENIPFQDDRKTPLMKMDRREMNRRMSAICERYGLDYWIWTPADYDLADPAARSAALDEHEELYRDCSALKGVFFPGGDPGDNPAELVLPFLEDISKRLLPIHPEARVWLSLQHFNRKEIAYVMVYMKTEQPAWLGGLVAGPSAPPVALVRNIMPADYQYRLYPDLTHNKICQYPVPWWDQAYALTLGREAINPRPSHYAYISKWFLPCSDGFISYSDGVHDDLNKTIWSGMSWDPHTEIREIVTDYTRVFFGSDVAEGAADGILALENNWQGPLKDNGAVEGTLLSWQQLEKQAPQLNGNWRWQMYLMRANYDAYVRHRLLNEKRLEAEANAILADASTLGADKAMDAASAVLTKAVDEPVSTELRDRIYALCDDLFASVGLQTSVEKYHASGAERGASLDFVDYPLNNRWWLEDEFTKVRAMPSEAEKCARLLELATWESPGPGSYYDDVGNTANSPHVKRSTFVFTEPGEEAHPEPILWWWDDGQSRARLSWQVTMNYPEAVVYEGLDPNGTYVVRCGGYGKFLLRIDGDLVNTDPTSFEMGENQDFAVPAKYLEDRKLELTWDAPTDEGHLNWRKHSRLAEVWLLKK